MSTRRFGTLLVIAGVIIFLVSLSIDYIALQDQRLGASQILGMEIGIAGLLVGLLLTKVYADQRFDLRNSIRAITDRVINLPVGFWVMTGFILVYIVFFISPVFLNSEHSMRYFNRFIPDKTPIGLDIRAVVNYIQDWLVSNQSPYADGFIAYPPLALALFAPLLLIGYPAYYFLITFISLSMFIVSALVIPFLNSPKKNAALVVLLFGLGLFSYGFQFELERGQSNVIAFSLCLIAIHLFYADQKYRYPAYLLFTLGVQMKIYPAILVLMFIENWRDWKSNVKRVAGILLLNLSLLFILGFELFRDFLRALESQQTYSGSWNGNHSLKGFVFHLALDGFGLFSPGALAKIQQNAGGIEFVLLSLIGFCLFMIILRAYRDGSIGMNYPLLLVCTIAALVIPSISNDYKLPILTGPIALVFCNLSMPAQRLRKIFTIVLILVISMAYWSIQYPFVVKPYFLTRNFPALFILMLAVSTLVFLADWRQSTAVREASLADAHPEVLTSS